MGTVKSPQEQRLDPYAQNDLRQRCIRLLDLDPVDVNGSNPVQGSLRVVSLDRNPSYEALSYIWGRDSTFPSRQIICSGVAIPITKNCYDALYALKQNFKVRSIWVDAICIKQNDSSEKAHQIPLMREIYGNARRVFIWLGSSSEKSDKALEWVLDTSRSQSSLSAVRVRNFPASLSPGEAWKVLKILPRVIAKHRMKHKKRLPYNSLAMRELASNDWFKRVWTFQELIMANEPLFVYGNKSMTWDDLDFAIGIARNHPDERNRQLVTDMFYHAATTKMFWLTIYTKRELTEPQVRQWISRNGSAQWAWHRFLDILENERWIGKVQNILLIAAPIIQVFRGERPFNSWWYLLLILSQILTKILTPQVSSLQPGTRPPWELSLRETIPTFLQILRSRQATLPVDKVFALYGVFQELGIPLQPPDYTKTVAEVYLDFTCTMIRWHESLEIIMGVSGSSVPDLPSWVPDWSRPYFFVVRRGWKAAGDSAPSFTLANCTKDGDGFKSKPVRPHSWPISPGSSKDSQRMSVTSHARKSPQIITKGSIVDKVDFCISELQEDTNRDLNEQQPAHHPTSTFLHNLSILIHWLMLSRQPRFHADQSPATILETLFKVMHSEKIDAGSENDVKYSQKFGDWFNFLKPSFEADISTHSRPLKSLATALKADKELYLYHVERCLAIAGKRLFFTTEEGRLGAGPPHTRLGDVVALLAGFCTPIILRKCGLQTYEVVGIAYVEGIMQGEAWTWNEESIQELTFI